MFFYVQLWQNINQPPVVRQRVEAPSEGHAVVQLMKHYHLHSVDRAWVSRSALEPPTVRLIEVVVKGNKRIWRYEPPWMTCAQSSGRAVKSV